MGSPHAMHLRRATDWCYSNRPGGVFILGQTPIRLSSRSMPEPDLVIVRYEPREYRDQHPGATDILLLIEISDTSPGYDRGVKRRKYAAAGIPDYWILAVAREKVRVNRAPVGGRYTAEFKVGRGETIAPLAFPEMLLSVDNLFG